MSDGNKALLASAAYIDFFDSNDSVKTKNEIKNAFTKERHLNTLQADRFLNTYEVIDQQLETE
ncbi:hypothetical protein [Spirabiliibacterium falconis]|uniref:hypothetical protein n=1 Tax=Spirabiliibacterium falconis TaxID=572023 RepID=UPI001AAC5BFF|nr:hypothetical protein [Spirabiliibacterium falconis]MBE2893655.1 hypothetical protein [Spirabiliibacterium falconis]